MAAFFTALWNAPNSHAITCNAMNGVWLTAFQTHVHNMHTQLHPQSRAQLIRHYLARHLHTHNGEVLLVDDGVVERAGVHVTFQIVLAEVGVVNILHAHSE